MENYSKRRNVKYGCKVFWCEDCGGKCNGIMKFCTRCQATAGTGWTCTGDKCAALRALIMKAAPFWNVTVAGMRQDTLQAQDLDATQNEGTQHGYIQGIKVSCHASSFTIREEMPHFKGMFLTAIYPDLNRGCRSKIIKTMTGEV